MADGVDQLLKHALAGFTRSEMLRERQREEDGQCAERDGKERTEQDQREEECVPTEEAGPRGEQGSHGAPREDRG